VQSLRAELAWSPDAPRVARAVVRAWSQATGCDGTTADDVVLATSELVTRAVNGCPAAPTLECSYGPDGMRVAVGSAPMLDGWGESGGELGDAVLWSVCDAWGRVDEVSSTQLWALVRC
jgi:hypothetical protein